MSDKAEVKGRALPESRQQMVIHRRVDDAKSVGKRDARSGRYIPIGGGSRTRLPVSDDPRIPRYLGFVGINPRQSEDIYTLPALYAELDHAARAPAAQGSELAAPAAGELPTEDDGVPVQYAEEAGPQGVPEAQASASAAPAAGELPAQADAAPAAHAEEADSQGVPEAQASASAASAAEEHPAEDDAVPLEHAVEEDSAPPGRDSGFDDDGEPKPKRDDVLYI